VAFHGYLLNKLDLLLVSARISSGITSRHAYQQCGQPGTRTTDVPVAVAQCNQHGDCASPSSKSNRLFSFLRINQLKHALAEEETMHVTFDDAQQAIAAALRKAEQLGTQMCIAVVDSGASLKAFARMNDAWVGSIDIAIKKAKTACFFGMPTGQIGRLSQPGGSLFGIEHSNEGLITFPGGLPIVNKEGVLIGAIGVSGSSVENDHLVAEAGVEVIGLSDLPAHPWRT